MEYSSLFSEIANRIESDPKGFSALDGHGVKELGSFFGNDIVGECLDGRRTNRSKDTAVRRLLKLFGISSSGGTAFVAFDRKTVRAVVSQLRPVAKYFSVKYFERLTTAIMKLAPINQIGRNQSQKFVDTVGSLAKYGKLADVALGCVADSQFRSAQDRDGEPAENPKKDERVSTNKEAALKEELQRLRKQLERRSVSAGSDELFVERLEETISKVAPSVKFISEKWRGDSSFKRNHGATEVLHISDWHIGEVDNIGGFNSFNYGIACERVKTLTNKVISWTDMHRSMYRVDELVVLATGDMISGEIHDELKRTNEFPAPEQCVKAAMLVSKMVNELSSFFKKVRVEYIVQDNHSRTTKKMEFAPGTNSYNYIVGTIAQIMLRDNPTVEFNVYPDIQKVVQVEGMRYLITHGNSIRGGFAGIPYYGMNRKLGAEAFIRMNMPEENHFDKIIIGHYHTPLLNRSFEMTGCLSSTTAFDHSAGRHCPACQTGWLVSKKFEMDYSIFWLS